LTFGAECLQGWVRFYVSARQPYSPQHIQSRPDKKEKHEITKASSDTMLAVIDRFKLVAVQQFGQFACIIAIILVAHFSQVIFARITDH
jgi:hypothetical protein